MQKESINVKEIFNSILYIHDLVKEALNTIACFLMHTVLIYFSFCFWNATKTTCERRNFKQKHPHHLGNRNGFVNLSQD